MTPICEIDPPDAGDFKMIAAAGRPVVMRGLVRDWPAVARGRAGADALGIYLKGMDNGRRTGCVLGPPEIGGRFFYRPDMSGFNFNRRDASVGDVIGQLAIQAGKPAPLAIAMQSTPLDDTLPGFAEANAMPLLPASVRPRIWIGNAIQVATHYDSADNIACVVGGRRRFTLFPPEQIANLYIGPFEMTPAGAPVSMVDPEAPDLARYPRFAEAQAAAQTAELEPGDALFIPYFWWHAVRSIDPLSVLVNYWWNDAGSDAAPLEAMLHAILALRELPPARRAIWKGMFDHLVFDVQGDPVAHLPETVRGVFGRMNETQRQELAQHLAAELGKKS